MLSHGTRGTRFSILRGGYPHPQEFWTLTLEKACFSAWQDMKACMLQIFKIHLCLFGRQRNKNREIYLPYKDTHSKCLKQLGWSRSKLLTRSQEFSRSLPCRWQVSRYLSHHLLLSVESWMGNGRGTQICILIQYTCMPSSSSLTILSQCLSLCAVSL